MGNGFLDRTRATRFFLAVSIATAVAPVALAVPVTYQFSTGTTAVGSAVPAGLAEAQALAAALNGFAVTGTFVYDNEAPLIATTPDGLRNIFAPAVLNLTGSVNGNSFADASGVAMVGDEGFVLPSPPPPAPPSSPVDFLQLAFNGPPPAPSDFTGFTLNGSVLTNVRMFWIESQATPVPIPDFLSDSLLPGALPSFNGRLALDFSNGGPLDDIANIRFIFFDNLIVTRVPTSVPEPATLSLLGLGLLGLAAAKRRRSARPLR